MNDDVNQGERTESRGRILHTTAYGDTAEEIELAALDKGREFFGADRRLEVVHDYQVTGFDPRYNPEGAGKRYVAGVKIQTVES